MRLGIMADSHGEVQRVRLAVEQLESLGAEAIIHCGDVGDLDVLDTLSGRPCWFVWGNMDRPAASWRPYIESIALPWPTGPIELCLADRKLAVFHGHEAAFRRALRIAEHDYLFHGHTHRPSDQRVGTMRVVNPGALHRVASPTVALLDLASDELRFLDMHGRPAWSG